MTLDPPSEVDFSALVLGFCSAALSYMGFGPEQLSRNLILARQNIEIIELLARKTQGNLSPEEDKLTQEVLHDLRLKFVDATRNP